MTEIQSPAPRPCASCPYRRDVPSGVWAPEEYAKLPAYDRPTGEQPTGVFLCHQQNGRVCGGWAGCHDGDHLLALRLAGALGHMSPEGIDATRDYVSPVPLWSSGEEAFREGMRGVAQPGEQADEMRVKLTRQLDRDTRRMREDLDAARESLRRTGGKG